MKSQPNGSSIRESVNLLSASNESRGGTSYTPSNSPAVQQLSELSNETLFQLMALDLLQKCDEEGLLSEIIDVVLTRFLASGVGYYTFDHILNNYNCKHAFGVCKPLQNRPLDSGEASSLLRDRSLLTSEDPGSFRTSLPVLNNQLSGLTGTHAEDDTLFILQPVDGENLGSDIVLVAMNNNVKDRASGIPSVLFTLLKQVCTTANRLSLKLEQRQFQLLLKTVLHKSEETFCLWEQANGITIFSGSLWRGDIAPKNSPPIENIFGLPEYFEEKVWLKLNKQLAENLVTGSAFNTEYELLDCRGEIRCLRTKVTPLTFSSKGSTRSFAATTTDITEENLIKQQFAKEAETEHWLLNRVSYLFNHHDQSAVTETVKQLGELLGVDRCFVRPLAKNMDISEAYAEWNAEGVHAISKYPFNMEVARRWAPENEQLSRGQDIFIEDINLASDPDESFIEYQKTVNARSSMLLPVMNKDTIIALLTIHYGKVREWTETEKRTCRLLANAIGTVLFQDSMLRQLQESEKRFESAMNAAGYGGWELNLQINTFYPSGTLFETFGYSGQPKTYVLSKSNPVMHADDWESILTTIERMRRGEITECDYESRVFRADRSIAWTRTRAKVIKWDKDGNPLRIMGVDMDITPHKSLMTNLQIARQAADSANTAKSEFLARMSHEIRTPMNAIIGLNYLMLQTQLSAQQERYVKDIGDAANSLLGTINNILDFSKIEAGKMKLDIHECMLPEFIHSIETRFSNECEKKSIGFILQADSLPKSIMVDSTRLLKIIDSLLENALKFTDRGTITLGFQFKSGFPKSRLLVRICDTGVGMDDSQQESLFDAFAQADSSITRQYQGTGLGLTISRHLVHLMGGDIKAQSEPDNGTTVSFTIECEPGPQNHDVPDEPSDDSQSSKPLSELRVLLVEDNVVNQKVAEGLLKKQGVSVTILNDGLAALAACESVEKGHFDAILMDIEMPKMNGFEAATAIRRLNQHRHIPILAMTAHSVSQRQPYWDSGFTDILRKPITPDALYKSLQNLGNL